MQLQQETPENEITNEQAAIGISEIETIACFFDALMEAEIDIINNVRGEK